MDPFPELKVLMGESIPNVVIFWVVCFLKSYTSAS